VQIGIKEREVERSDRAIEDASTFLLRAGMAFRKAKDAIPATFRERFILEVPRRFNPEFLRSCRCDQSNRRLECIRSQKNETKISELMVSKALVAAKEVANKLEQDETSLLRKDSRENKVAIETEKNVILDGLRSHVSEIVDPSAPSEKFDFL
jgi:hypothetical protein